MLQSPFSPTALLKKMRLVHCASIVTHACVRVGVMAQVAAAAGAMDHAVAPPGGSGAGQPGRRQETEVSGTVQISPRGRDLTGEGEIELKPPLGSRGRVPFLSVVEPSHPRARAPSHARDSLSIISR